MKKRLITILILSLLITNLSNICYASFSYDIYEEITPTAASVVDPNTNEVLPYKKKENKIILSSDLYDEISTPSNITYIRHTNSITTVYDGTYVWSKTIDKDRWKLSIEDGLYYHGDAKSGFYKVDGKIYYFDKDGLMVTGEVLDERNIQYIFAESGELISTTQLK